MTKTLTMDIQIGEQAGKLTVPIQYDVNKPVYETVTKWRVTREEQLRFFCLAGVACLVLLYFGIVILSYGRCLWNRTTPGKSLELQLTGTITFLTGCFCGCGRRT